ncbi:hypothetical protein BC827DRAFT_343733 [Russula dissimulans]|nr:hypothetical protein BC827DRAFT_343733 [Russula dissimulans]
MNGTYSITTEGAVPYVFVPLPRLTLQFQVLSRTPSKPVPRKPPLKHLYSLLVVLWEPFSSHRCVLFARRASPEWEQFGSFLQHGTDAKGRWSRSRGCRDVMKFSTDCDAGALRISRVYVDTHRTSHILRVAWRLLPPVCRLDYYCTNSHVSVCKCEDRKGFLSISLGLSLGGPQCGSQFARQ